MDLWLLRRDAGHLSDLRLPLPALPPKRLVIGLKQAASLGTLNFQAVDQRPKRTHPPPVSKHLECLPFHENWWAPVQRRSASKRCPPQCQKQLISQSVKRTVRVGPLWTPIYSRGGLS